MIKKPERLSDEKICARWGAHPTTGNVGIYRDLYQQGIDYCYKEMLRQIISSLNMRDVGGIEPEWAISNKDYQALQEEA